MNVISSRPGIGKHELILEVYISSVNMLDHENPSDKM